MYYIFYKIFVGGENINKILTCGIVLLAIVLVAGGYAYISSDNAPQVTNNPVSNEISDVNNSSSSNGSVPVPLKNVPSKSISPQITAVSGIVSLDSLVDLADSSNSSSDGSNSPYHVVHYAANVGGSYDDHSSNNNPVINSLSSNPYENINKEDYVLSPNYNDHIFIKKGQDFTDKYGLCVVDGFIPLGNITKEIDTNFICNLECGIGDVYYDLSSPYVYDTMDVIYFLNNGVFPDDVSKKQMEYELNRLATNYRQVEGQNEVYVNVHDDFTDKYMLCMDCGRYFALGNVTTPLDDIMICDHPTHFGGDVYIDVTNPSVISPEDAYNSWNSDGYLKDLYSNPDYHPIHFDEEGYGEEPQSEPSQQYVPDEADSGDQHPKLVYV